MTYIETLLASAVMALGLAGAIIATEHQLEYQCRITQESAPCR